MTANTNMNEKLKIDLTTLETILETYGSKRSKWPVAMREPLVHFIEGSEAAQKLVEETKALEHVMDMSPGMTANDALKERIIASAMAVPDGSAHIVPFPQSKQARPLTPSTGGRRLYWPAVAMAASFCFGLYLGVAGLGSQTFESAVQVSGLVSGNGDAESAPWLDLVAGTGTEDAL